MTYVTVTVVGLGCLLVLFLQHIAGQLIICAIVRAVDKIASSQRKNKKRIYISFIFLSLLLLHTRMPKYVYCILIYIKLSYRNIHYSFIVSKTH